MTESPADRPRAIRPIVHSQPLGIGDLIGGSFRAVFNRPGLYFGLTLVTVVFGSATLAGPALLLQSFQLQSGAPAALPSWGMPALMLSAGMALPALLVYIKVQAILSLATDQLVAGREPGLRALWGGTRNALPRSILLMVVVGLGTITIGAVVALLLLSAGGDPASLGLALLLVLPLVYVVTIVVSIRLYVVLPVIAVERRGATDALTRTWQLTRGSFWVTLGRLIVFQIIVSVVSTALGASVGTIAGVFPNAPFTAEFASFGAAALSVLLVLPYSSVYTSLIYVDRRRRTDGFVPITPRTGAVVSPYDASGQYRPGFGPTAPTQA